MSPENQKKMIEFTEAALKIDKVMKELEVKKKLIYKHILNLMGEERAMKTTTFSAYINKKDSYRLKEWVSDRFIIDKYPEAVKIDAKKVYEIAEKPEQFVEKVEWDPYLTIKATSAKDSE